MLSAEGAPRESESGLVEPLKVGPGSYTRNCRAKGKVKGTRPTCRAPSVGVSHPPRSYKSPYSDRGARIPGCVFWHLGENSNLGSESFAWEMKAKLKQQARWPGLLGRKGRDTPVSSVLRPQPAVPWGLTLALQLLGRPSHCCFSP